MTHLIHRCNIGIILVGASFIVGGYLLPHEWLVNYVNNSELNGSYFFDLGVFIYTINNIGLWIKNVLESSVSRKRAKYMREFPDYAKYQ